MTIASSAVTVFSSISENTVVSTITTNLFPVGRIVKLYRKATNVVNSTNPITATLNITLTVVECCAPPPLRLAADCVALGTVAVSAFVSPNPVSIGAVAHFVTKIYEEC